MNIRTLIKKDLTLFLKSKSSVALTFLVPMVITLIFGAVFGGFGKTKGMNDIKILLVDDDNSEYSQKFHALLNELEELTIHTKYKKKDDFVLFDQQKMDEWIQEGKRKLGIFIPKGFSEKIKSGGKVPLQIHFDPKYQIEYGIIMGLVQKTIMNNFPQILLNGMFRKANEELEGSDEKSFQKKISELVKDHFSISDTQDDIMKLKSEEFNFLTDPLAVKSIKLLGNEESDNSMFAQYVAGIAVLFLLFSVTHAGASLIEEKRNGTIDRLLIAPVRRSHILISKMIYISLLGLMQLIVLFIFGWLVFQLNIFKDIPALLTMIIVTALACSSVGIFIAAVCKTIEQVDNFSTLVILGMSALGGSMFPTIIMPKYIQAIGKFTVNHWAMKGITDIFWYNKHLSDIYPSILVLLGITIVFSFFAIKIFNRRLMS